MAFFSHTLQSSNQVMSSGDVIGILAYAASNESSNGDARLISGSIESVAEGDFTAVANPASLVFSTSVSADAVEQMRLTSEGYLGINTQYPASQLHVVGSTTIDGSATISAAATGRNLTIGGNADFSAAIQILGSGMSGSTEGLLIAESNAGAAYIYQYENAPIYFATAGAYIGGFSNNGGLMLGTSTNTYGTGSAVLYATGAPRIKLQNFTTGTTSADGSDIYLDFADLIITNKEAAGDLILKTADVDRIYIQNDGNVGIGTSTPSYELDVAGQTRITPGAAEDAMYIGRGSGKSSIKASAADASSQYLLLDSAGQALQLNTYADDDVIICAGGGNVGISQTNTLAKFHVTGANDPTYYTAVFQDTTSYGTDVGAGIILRGAYTSGGTQGRFGGIKSGKLNATDGNAESYLSLQYSDGSTLTEGVRIQDDSIQIRNPLLAQDGATVQYTAGTWGLKVQEVGDSTDGIQIGDAPFDSRFQAIGHTSYVDSDSYIIATSGTDTYISARTGDDVIIRGGGNDGTYQIRVASDECSMGNGLLQIVGGETRFNPANADQDVTFEGVADTQLLAIDAGLDKVAIGTNPTSLNEKFHVDGNIQATNTDGSNASSLIATAGTNELVSRAKTTAPYNFVGSLTEHPVSLGVGDNESQLVLGNTTDNYNVSVGSNPVSNAAFQVSKEAPSIGPSSYFNTYKYTTVPSGDITALRGVQTSARLQDGADLANYYAFSTGGVQIEGDADVATVIGYYANGAAMNGSLSNYGIYSDIASGDVATYGLYIAGTAENFMSRGLQVSEDKGAIGSDYKIDHVENCQFGINAAAQAGYIKIRLPAHHSTGAKWTNTMLMFDVDIYNYSTIDGGGKGKRFTFGGYTYSTTETWTHPTASCAFYDKDNEDNDPWSVRFANDPDGYPCILIYKASSGYLTQWDYPQVTISNVRSGFGSFSFEQWSKGWETSLETSSDLAASGYTNNQFRYISVPLTNLQPKYNLYAGGNGAANDFTNHVVIDGTQNVFNENGDNVDFRVEGDTQPNLLFCDASTDRIGIGTDSPTNLLNVNAVGNGAGTHTLLTGDDNSYLSVQNNGTGDYLKLGNVYTSQIYLGVSHSDFPNSTYMMMSNGAHTFVSANAGYSVYVRGGGNNSAAQMRIGTSTEFTGSVVFNEAGSNADLRVEGDTDPYLLFADASKDSVLIGTSTDGGVGSKLNVFQSYVANTTIVRTQNLNGQTVSTANGTYYHTCLNTRAEKHLSSGVTDGGYCIGSNFAPIVFGEHATLAELTALRCNPSFNVASTGCHVTNMYALKIVPYNGGVGNTITNNFGVYIPPLTPANNNYGIYQGGASDTNVFAAATTFGSTVSARNGYAVTSYGFMSVEADEAKLLVIDGVVASKMQASTNNSAGVMGTESAHNLHLYAGNSPQVVVTTDGKLGIGGGSVAPTEVLDVVGNLSDAMSFTMQQGNPPGSGDKQQFKLGSEDAGITIEHHQNHFNGDGSLYLTNAIRMGNQYVSIDAPWSCSIGCTYYPKLYIDTVTGATTFNDSFTFPTGDGEVGQVLETDGSGSVSWKDINASPSVNQGRLSPDSTSPLPNGIYNDITSVYYHPFGGNKIVLYNGSDWREISFTSTTISLASGYAANTNYDLYAYNNSGTLAFEAVAWSDDTTRAIAVVYYDGILIKDGDPSRKLMGTIRTVTATTTSYNNKRKFVSNLYHRRRSGSNVSQTGSRSYSGTDWRHVNANANKYFDYVSCISQYHVEANVSSKIVGAGYVAVVLDAVPSVSTYVIGDLDAVYGDSTTATKQGGVSTIFQPDPSPGYHKISIFEKSDAGASVTFERTNTAFYVEG